MTIQETISKLITKSEEIKKAYPTVENVRHCVYDIPYGDLKTFAGSVRANLHTDLAQKRAYIIHSTVVNGLMDTDVWLYSTIIKIKPAEIIEE